MADRTSALIFGRFFKHLSKNPTNENKEFAKELFQDCREYDFSYYQMDSDDALISLELAHNGIDSDYPEDGLRVIYEPPPT